MNIASSLFAGALLLSSSAALVAESLWLEAEHMDGMEGYCWPMGPAEIRTTKACWGLSGPGWAAEWMQGGESGFLSVACGADDDKAKLTKTLEIPADGTYSVWVRYGDWREATEKFQIKVEQEGAKPWIGSFGEKPMVEEDNEMKLYWGWAFAWDHRDVPLKKGPAKLSLISNTKESHCRQVDVIVLTTDRGYQPMTKDQPTSPAWSVLDSYREGGLAKLEPFVRNPPKPRVADSWKPRTYRDKGFLYLWNMDPEPKWLSDDPKRVLHPHHVRDEDLFKAFVEKYGGQKNVPIFSDPRIVPTFLGVGSVLLQTDSADPKVKDLSQRFVKWLDANPNRCFAATMNYCEDVPLSPGTYANFMKYRDRFLGSISGENLGYFEMTIEAQEKAGKDLVAATAKTTKRREIVEAITSVSMPSNAEKYRKVFGKPLDKPYMEVIPCQSVGMVQFAPISFLWGARTVGYESFVATSAALGMRMAFLRGAARQNGGLTATYRSCNFGDSATLFCETMRSDGPKAIYDNFYDVYSGAGMTWYKMDIWYQYMAGSSMFYHEQGFDEFWLAGGAAAAGLRPIALSPKGQLVDRFLKLSAAKPDRGTMMTPVAFLVDYAHGWEPTSNYPGGWDHYGVIPHEKTPYTDHHQMMHEYFWTAYHPLGPKSQQPISALSETYVPGIFGDIFDVIYAYPDVSKWTTIDTYPVVIVAGDIELTAAEGERLNRYVEKGGTLLVADAQLSGPGAAALKLPSTGQEAEANSYLWLDDKTQQPSQQFRFRPIQANAGRAIATTVDGRVICASMDQGKGRLIYFSVRRGMGVDLRATPMLARLFGHLTRGVMPVEVDGEVEWFVNQNDKGWLVTLLNPAGQTKPQHGITPTDYRFNKRVTIRTRQPMKKASDRLLETDTLVVNSKDGVNTVECTVLAGSVRIIELR